MSLKASARRILSRLLGSSIDRALSYAERCSVVSFDIFDTLILRRCSPHDVFSIAEEKYNAKHGEFLSTFRQDRVEAEHRARSTSTREDITLGEIYCELADIYGADKAGELRAMEIRAEFEAVYPNEELREFYGLVRELSRRIVITSDMYLPSSIVAEMLRMCGYEGYEKLYVSSDFGLSKRKGGLFRFMLWENGVKPSEVIHIGDNLLSDYLVPKRFGMSGFLYRGGLSENRHGI